MARNRPGKRERQEAKRNAFQEARASIIRANLEAPRPAKPVPCGPKGLRSSTASVDRLKGGSHNVGFVGPRGFKTPRDLVQPLKRGEVRVGNLAGPRFASERNAALALAALAKKD